MKIFTYIVFIIAVGLIAYNATNIDLKAPLEGESQVAIICIIAAICAVLLLSILNMSKKVVKKLDD